MPITISHAFQSPLADTANPDEVGPDEWNANHTFSMAANSLLGRSSASAGAVQEIACNADAVSMFSIASIAQGDILYRGAAGFERLPAGTSGHLLQTNGAGANPAWAAITGITPSSGSAPYYGARAWVNFNGTGTAAIRASGNITSITDNGTGDFTLNFTTAQPDTNYAVTSSSRISSVTSALTQNCVCHPVTYSTGSVRVHTGRANASQCDDHEFSNVAIFR